HEPLLHGGNYGRVAVAGHEGSKTKIEVDIFIAVEVVNVGSLGVFYKQGPGLVTTEVAGDAKRHAGFGPFESGLGTWGTCFKSGEFLLQKVVHEGSSFAREGCQIVRRAGCSQENALACERTGGGPPAQPGFAASVAEKPPHP